MLNRLYGLFGNRKLRFVYTFTVIVVMALTIGMMFFVRYMFVRTGLIPKDYEVTVYLVVLAILALAAGGIIAGLFSRIPVTPVRKIISATDKLAEGDFSARLDLRMGGEMADFNKSFNKMASELERSQILRTDFINNFAHECKTPMISIRGFAEMIKDKELTEEEEKEYLDIIISESNRLIDLSANILSMVKLENSSEVLSREEYNLSEQIREAIILLATKWDAKNLIMDFDSEEVMVTANSEMLMEVWINLIDNAIKFSPEGGLIAMGLKSDGKNIKFTIFNQGPAMDEETISRIFDKFYQGDTSHAQKGYGLGLPLSKKILQLHGGDIWVQNSGENGTTFEIILPEGRV